MENTNIFEMAIRNKYRYNYKGFITTEDLFDLPVSQLDTIFKGLNVELKNSQQESLLTTKSDETSIIENKIAIIKYIVAIKVEEQAKREDAKKKKEQKQKIMELINNKEENSLAEKSIDELKKILEGLES